VEIHSPTISLWKAKRRCGNNPRQINNPDENAKLSSMQVVREVVFNSFLFYIFGATMLTLMIVAGLAYWFFNSQVSKTSEGGVATSHIAVTPRHNGGESVVRAIMELIAKARQRTT
jgi:hypothetical protein